MRTAFAVLMLTACAGTAMADEDHSIFWYARAKIACIADATRLCRSAMPDSDKVRECMKDKKALVSPGCAEFYPGGKNAD